VVLGNLDGEGAPAKDEAGLEPPLATLLAALASMLHDSASRFEETSDRIAELVVERESGSGPELIVALQDFDRLRQEFLAIGSALSRCAKLAHETSPSQVYPLRDLLAEIPLVDFKRRLVQCLAWMASPPSVPDGELVDEQVF
jgi:hypothetical protein